MSIGIGLTDQQIKEYAQILAHNLTPGEMNELCNRCRVSGNFNTFEEAMIMLLEFMLGPNRDSIFHLSAVFQNAVNISAPNTPGAIMFYSIKLGLPFDIIALEKKGLFLEYMRNLLVEKFVTVDNLFDFIWTKFEINPHIIVSPNNGVDHVALMFIHKVFILGRPVFMQLMWLL